DLGDRAGVAGFVCTRAAYIGAAGFSRQAASGGAALDTTLDRSRVAVITESDGHIRVVPAVNVGCWRSYRGRRIGWRLIDTDAADRRGIGCVAGLVHAAASVGHGGVLHLS